MKESHHFNGDVDSVQQGVGKSVLHGGVEPPHLLQLLLQAQFFGFLLSGKLDIFDQQPAEDGRTQHNNCHQDEVVVVREEGQSEQDDQGTEDGTGVGDTGENAIVLALLLDHSVLHTDLVDVAALAGEHEGDAHSVDQGSEDCQEIPDSSTGSDHEEAGGAVEGEADGEEDHLPLLGDSKFGGEGIGDEEGEALDGKVHGAEGGVADGLPDFGDDTVEGAEAHGEEEVEEGEEEHFGFGLAHPMLIFK